MFKILQYGRISWVGFTIFTASAKVEYFECATHFVNQNSKSTITQGCQVHTKKSILSITLSHPMHTQAPPLLAEENVLKIYKSTARVCCK